MQHFKQSTLLKSEQKQNNETMFHFFLLLFLARIRTNVMHSICLRTHLAKKSSQNYIFQKLKANCNKILQKIGIYLQGHVYVVCGCVEGR